jgi:hypothetical protein
MSVTVAGFVKNGVVVPNGPLPEGAFVGIQIIHAPTEIPPELRDEFADWERASAGTVETVERLAEEMERDEKG